MVTTRSRQITEVFVFCSGDSRLFQHDASKKAAQQGSSVSLRVECLSTKSKHGMRRLKVGGTIQTIIKFRTFD